MKKKFLILLVGIFLMSFVSSALTDNLISYYKLDENAANTTVADAHGSNTGTSSTNTANLYEASGKINSAFDFNTEYVDTDLTQNLQTVSVSVWGKYDVDGHQGILVAKDTNAVRGWVTRTQQNHFGLEGNGAGISAGSITLTEGVWYHFVMTSDGTTVKGYVDGVLDINETFSFNSNTNADITIGRRNYIGVEGYFNGGIDEIGIWDRVLTQAEVTSLYNSGSGLAYPFGSSDTCSCPGLASNWEIDMSDYCNITEDCNLSTGKLSFIGTGITRINATITTSDLGDPGVNGILRILINCLIWVV